MPQGRAVGAPRQTHGDELEERECSTVIEGSKVASMEEQDYFDAKANVDRLQKKVLYLSPSLSGILKRGRDSDADAPEHAGTREEIEAAVEELKQAMLTVERIVRSLTRSHAAKPFLIANARKKLSDDDKRKL